GLFFFSQGLAQKIVSREPTPWWHYLFSWLLGVYVCALLTPPVLWLARRFPFERGRRLRRLALHLPASLAFSLIPNLIQSAIQPRLGLFPTVMPTFGATLGVLLVIGFHQNVMTYWTILGVSHGLDYYRRYHERAKEALRLELKAQELQTQLVSAQLSALK